MNNIRFASWITCMYTRVMSLKLSLTEYDMYDAYHTWYRNNNYTNYKRRLLPCTGVLN